MDILITGSNGFLGKELCSHLKNYCVKTLSRSASFYNIDLSKQIPDFNNSFDLVIHASGKAHLIPQSNEQIASFYEVNVVGTLNLLLGLSKYTPKQFVFISSVSVYGLINGENIDESFPLLAEDPYGKSKILAEDIVIKWCEKHNVICTILRLPLVVGPNPPGNLGSMIRGIQKGYYFNIAGGNAKKSMVLASDISNYIITVANLGGIYNLTDGFHPTFNDLSKSISKKLNRISTPNLPYYFAFIIAKFGDLFGEKFPLNSNKLKKITSSLTFNDSLARKNFGWTSNSVIENINLLNIK
jgi:nucleoside-diphosphate-sugar epimerase